MKFFVRIIKMGFFDSLSNISNYYHGFKSTVSHIFDVAKKVVHGVRSGGDWLNEKLDQLSAIPYLGDATKEAVKKGKDYKVFGIASFNDVMGYARWMDDTLQHSDIAENIASTADYYIEPVVDTLSGLGRALGGSPMTGSDLAAQNVYGSGVVAAG